MIGGVLGYSITDIRLGERRTGQQPQHARRFAPGYGADRANRRTG